MAFSDISSSGSKSHSWPSLDFQEWKDTCATLHRWTQIVGKIRLMQTPWINHSWHVTLYVTGRGLTTSPIPYGMRTFQIDFDFIDHQLLIQTNDGAVRKMALKPRSVADFHQALITHLTELGLPLKIWTTPNEIADAIPFEQDHAHNAYDAEYAHRFWQALSQIDRVFKIFRTRFIGKCSPVHFFWGSFDLAVTRFSGRPAPAHPGGVPNFPDWVAREAYSHEVCSCGFWPGGEAYPYPIFYAYAYPQPDGLATATVRPDQASFNTELGEFVLPYEAVRQTESPDELLLAFLQTTYEAAANSGGWDRSALEWEPPLPVKPS